MGAEIRQISPCDGPRRIARVEATWGVWIAGQFEPMPMREGATDRRVLITRDCGHVYHWGGPLDEPPPAVGGPAMQCLSPGEGTYKHKPGIDDKPAIFDPRPTRTVRPKRRRTA